MARKPPKETKRQREARWLIEMPTARIGVGLVLIKDLAPRVGVSSAAMYQAGSRGELHLLRIGECWAVDLAEAQTWAKVYRERHAARAAAKAERAAKRAARAATSALRAARAQRDGDNT